ncbi:MAG: MBL fold metallo-hydrolase [Verrucomicrobia bacterium]|nr:MBL fold metallo-hydrolase [Verrucomicrobiota bacterium]
MPLQIELTRDGLYVPRLALWLDPRRSRRGAERVVVTHAHSDHIGSHGEVILTEATAHLMRARVAGRRTEHRLKFGEAAEFRGPSDFYRVTLVPAGHIFGSAMSLVESDGSSLLYTGDFKLRRGLSAEPCEPRRADTLIMETTFGLPWHRFPPVEQVWADIVGFCRAALAEGVTPVLLAYSLGKAQELLLGLAAAGLPVMLQQDAAKLTRICGRCGLAVPPHETFAVESARGKVVVFPPTAKIPDGLAPRRTAVVTGWALDPGARFRFKTDAAFPLSDHADFGELLELAERVRPKRVLTVHGYAKEFAATLRERGVDARAIGQEEQLGLPI